eukprot:CAMPEP_0167752380 /NCGR_PEP_ID=MMETSP0110_2-20121227/7107_1 /TAXON_ID=629695 /ORGANISM="Gymnochlora sp., Strain CCMP2014" /LENGTH=562 /DNA_ID=CAMNT_0007637991 /DNA_START=59 /DNA_END=1747 /DNA_ORIENTATION=+
MSTSLFRRSSMNCFVLSLAMFACVSNAAVTSRSTRQTGVQRASATSRMLGKYVDSKILRKNARVDRLKSIGALPIPISQQQQSPGEATPYNPALLEEIMTDIQTLSREGEIMKRPSTNTVFFTVASAVVLSAISPFTFSEAITEVLVPSMASIVAVATASAEFSGKDATADAKEVAAVALAQAARAEAFLSRAEKAKAIIPAMVGVSATAATLCLIFPALMASGVSVNPLFVATCPIVATTAAAWAAAANMETLAQGLLALGKVAKNRILSVREASTPGLRRLVLRQRMNVILKSVIPPILIGLFMPGDFVFRCIVSSAVAAVAVAYHLAEAETVTSEVGLKVAMITKAAAQADVFANRAAAESSVLPFTSALAGTCLAVSAAVVEVAPAVAGFIPVFGAMASGVAAAASTRAEMDATSTRLSFRDAGVRRVAPLASVPNLFQSVVPAVFGKLAESAVDIGVNSMKNFLSTTTDRLTGEPPSPISVPTSTTPPAPSNPAAPKETTTTTMKSLPESTGGIPAPVLEPEIDFSSPNPDAKDMNNPARIRTRDRVKKLFTRNRDS